MNEEVSKLAKLVNETANKCKVPPSQNLPAERFIGSLDLARVPKPIDRAPVDVEQDALIHGAVTLASWYQACRLVLGPDEVKRNWRRWRSRAIREPERLRVLLAELREVIQEEKIHNPGAYAETMWKGKG